MPDYPSCGETFTSRDELNSLIRSAGKSRGYLIKQSITSEKKVTWYCSSKYSPARCVAGFKAALEDGEWTVIEATEHVEACTRARQRVHANKANLSDTPVTKAVKAIVKARPPSPTAARKASTVTRPTTRLSRKRPNFSKSIAPPSSPRPAASRDSPPTVKVTSDSLIVPTKQRRRSSTSSSIAADNAVRERSYSSGSWYSYTSEQTNTEEGGTILDPAFHFPTPAQAVFLGIPGEESQSVTMMRRKRSWSGSRMNGHTYGLP